MKKLLICFGAGAFGAVVERVAAWLAANSGLFTMAGSSYIPRMNSAFLYEHIVWGGIWAFALLLPGLSSLSWFQCGILLSLFPSAAELLYLMPKAGHGYFGIYEGYATPIFVFLLNLIWAIVTVMTVQKNK